MDPHLAKGRTEVDKSFHMVQRQTSWGNKDLCIPFSKFAAPEVAKNEEEDKDEEEKAEPPPLIPASCTCKWCMKWTVCEHTVP